MIKQVSAALFVVVTTPLCYANEATDKFVNELLNCSAYYQITSQALSQLDAPQMKNVAQRLSQDADKALELAQQYQPDSNLTESLAQAKQAQIATMKNAKDLGHLMARYKDSCKTSITDPQARLDYWSMATMKVY
ncbi:hypothetical protein [Shewanella marina]|uniref:hypothetical protein n=1 Tax=Shewanella marina TaxID=487319 RepID=UPI0004721BF1|nr:hypothetical protein [Shewanella marina]